MEQAFKEGWVAFRKAKRLTIGFETVLIVIFVVTQFEGRPNQHRILKEKKPPSGLEICLCMKSTALPLDSKHWDFLSMMVTRNSHTEKQIGCGHPSFGFRTSLPTSLTSFRGIS